MAELKVELGMKDEEICELKKQKMEALGQIREIAGIPGNTLNKAHLFDSYIKKEV